MQSPGYTRKYRTPLRTRFIADGDDVRKRLARAQHIGDGFRFVARNVDANLLHHLNHNRVEVSWFNPGTLSFELFRANLIKKRLSHLAARTIVNADE